MLLNARIAAVHLGYLTMPEFVVETRRTLATVARLPRYRGHLLRSWAMVLLERVRHARAWCESGLTPALAAALRNIARTAHEMVEGMDFAFLYDSRRKVLSIGCDVRTGRIEPSAYEPQVRATERLLEERVPRTIVPDRVVQPRLVWPEEPPAA